MSQIGQKVGNIRLVERIGRGGAGEVFAGYDEKLRREVAVKMIRGDRIDLDARARFLLEARVLSRLEHPNICRLYDYIEGQDNDVLVLEHVQGRNLQQADDLSWKVKLQIAGEMARTLAAAHARSIVHRDLKPSNVMWVDAAKGGVAAHVKILDFGLARLVAAEPGGREAEPDRMAQLSPPASFGDEISAKSSVETGAESVDQFSAADGTLTRLAAIGLEYEAGVVSGTPAYMSPEQARGEWVTAASDMYSFGVLLRELFTGAGAYPVGLPTEHLLIKVSEADTLPVPGVDRDLRALIESLESAAPEARPSASAIAERIGWIQQRPGRRRRQFLAITAAILIAAGAAKYTLDLRHERNEAVAAKQAETAARAEAEEVASFLTRLFDSADPYRRRQGMELRDVLAEGRQRIDTLVARPQLQTRLLTTLAKVHHSVGESETAMTLFEQARQVGLAQFGQESVELRDILHGMARVRGSSDFEAAANDYQQALALSERLPAMDSAGPLLKDYGAHLVRRGELAAAEPFLQRALDLEASLDPIANSEVLHHLGHIAYDRDELNQAEDLYTRALALSTSNLGQESTHAATLLNSLAQLELQRGRLAEGQGYLERARQGLERSADPDYPLLIQILHNEAGALTEMGDQEGSIALYTRVVTLREASQGPEHPELAISLGNLAAAQRRLGRYQAAAADQRRAVAIWRQAVGDSHPNLAGLLLNLARIVRAEGHDEEAQALLREAVGIAEATVGSGHAIASLARFLLGQIALDQGRRNEAKKLLAAAHDATRMRLEANPENRNEAMRSADILRNLGLLAAAEGDPEAARDQWQQALTLLGPGSSSPGSSGAAATERPGSLQVRALLLFHLNRISEARPILDSLRQAGWREPEFDRVAAILLPAVAAEAR